MQQPILNLPMEVQTALFARATHIKQEREAGNVVSYAEFTDKLFKRMGDAASTLHHATTGLSGEAGEILDISKKVWVYGKELDFQNMLEELGDLRFYQQVVYNLLGISEELVEAHNMFKLSLGENARFPNGVYTDAAAIARADKAAEGETVSSGVDGLAPVPQFAPTEFVPSDAYKAGVAAFDAKKEQYDVCDDQLLGGIRIGVVTAEVPFPYGSVGFNDFIDGFRHAQEERVAKLTEAEAAKAPAPAPAHLLGNNVGGGETTAPASGE